MAGILDFLSNGIFQSSVKVDENSCRWSAGLITKLNKFTGTIFAFFACIVFGKELLGDHIHCISVNEESQISESSFNSYCYISSTFTLPPKNLVGDREANSNSAYLGVKPLSGDEEPVYHSYYQWIPYLFFIQAITFFAPYNLYKFSLDGRISFLIQNLNNVIPFTENRDDKLGDIHLYLQDFYGSHKWWARKLMMSDLMNLMNVVFNIVLMNWYLGQNFLVYGVGIIQYYTFNLMYSPADVVFPKMTKCTLKLYGPSGTIQNHDALCVMPVNLLNEKLFFILWLILLPLAVMTLIDQFVWFIFFFCKDIRNGFLCKFVLPQYPARRKRLGKVLDHLEFGDWLVLYLVARNIDSALFTALADKIHKPGAGYFPDEDDDDISQKSLEDS